MTISFSELVRQEDWEELRKRVKRLRSPSTINNAVDYCALKSRIPDDILVALISKFEAPDSFDETLMSRVCRHWDNAPAALYFKKVGAVIERNDVLQPDRKEIFSLNLHRLVVRNNKSSDFEKLFQVSSLEELQSNTALARHYRFWQRVVVFVKATKVAFLDTEDTEDIPLVKTLIQMAAPKVIIWLALRLYPEQASRRDSLGRICLHWAACDKQEGDYIGSDFMTEACDSIMAQVTTKEESKLSVLEIVLNAFPEGASYTDNDGMTPLALLLDQQFRINNTPLPGTEQLALALAKASPKALAMTNPSNRMFPFMQVATWDEQRALRHAPYLEEDSDSEEEDSDNEDEYNETKQEEAIAARKVNLTFALLMENPTVATSGIEFKATDREIWLTEKLDESQDQNQRLERELQRLREENNTFRQQLGLPKDTAKVPPSVIYNLGMVKRRASDSGDEKQAKKLKKPPMVTPTKK